MRVAALELSSYEGEALGEPAGDVKAVEHMAGTGKVLRDGWPGMSGTRR